MGFLDHPTLLAALAVACLAIALLLAGLGLLHRQWRQWRLERVMDRTLDSHRQTRSTASAQTIPQSRFAHFMETVTTLGGRWARSRFGDLLLPREDRQLLEQGGFDHPARTKALFVFGRTLLALGLPLFSWLAAGRVTLIGSAILGQAALLFACFALGWMLPKWLLLRHVQARRAAVSRELPLLIDGLRLLQGVGLSMDQSLHVIVEDFAPVMPVLSRELQLALNQYSHGRTREQSLHRLGSAFGNDDLAALCRLIAQVDQHGGAVQEPLTRFSARLREQRKLDLKEKIGHQTVKMTAVMVLTLMPALIIVTGGAGFIAIIRGLARVTGGQ